MLRAKLFAIPLLTMTAMTLALPAQAYNDDAAADAMEDSWNIVQNASSSPEHKTLAKAISSAGLSATLSGPGPFTVFAPTDQAFAAVPAPLTNYLMDPSNKWALEQLLTYHVVRGDISTDDLYAKIEAGGGKAVLTTVEGENLTFTIAHSNIKVDGTQGSTGYITQSDVDQSNGVIHVLNGVLIPTLTPPAAPAAAEPEAEAAADAAQAADVTPAE